MRPIRPRPVLLAIAICVTFAITGCGGDPPPKSAATWGTAVWGTSTWQP